MCSFKRNNNNNNNREKVTSARHIQARAVSFCFSQWTDKSSWLRTKTNSPGYMKTYVCIHTNMWLYWCRFFSIQIVACIVPVKRWDLIWTSQKSVCTSKMVIMICIFQIHMCVCVFFAALFLIKFGSLWFFHSNVFLYIVIQFKGRHTRWIVQYFQ